MDTREWRPNPAWVEVSLAAGELLLHHYKDSTRLAVGQLVLRSWSRPWRWPAMIRGFAKLLGRRRQEAVLDWPALAPAIGPPQYDARKWRRASDAFADCRALLRSPAYRLGGLLVELAKGPTTLLRAWPLLREPDRWLPALSPDFVWASARVEASPDWRCLAPGWLEEMLAHEGVPRWRPGDPGPVLFCPGAGPVPDLPETCLETTAWVVGSRLIETEREAIALCEHRFRLDDIPPAVQPIVHNPIDWWEGKTGLQHDSEVHGEVPEPWLSVFMKARGLIGTEQAAPSWADESWRLEYGRYQVMRDTILHDSLRVRLSQITEASGRPLAARTRPRVTAVLCSRRPGLVERALTCFSTQTYSPKAVVLVAHGPGFDFGLVEDLKEKLGIEVSLLNAPADWPLGRCLELGCEAADGDLIWKMDDDDYYGPSFLEDSVMTLMFSDAGVTGKPVHAVRFRDRSLSTAWLRGPEYVYSSGGLPGGTMVFRKEVLKMVSWRPLPKAVDTAFVRDCISSMVPILRGGRFHFVRIRDPRLQHTSRHVVRMGATHHPLPDAIPLADFSPTATP
jgi:hypothetical protein